MIRISRSNATLVDRELSVFNGAREGCARDVRIGDALGVARTRDNGWISRGLPLQVSVLDCTAEGGAWNVWVWNTLGSADGGDMR